MAHIILIEDEPLLRQVIVSALRLVGHQIHEAPNGRTAMALLRGEPPDLVITDIFMPERDGLETIMAVRELNANIPIIAISGHAAESSLFLKVAQNLGARRTLAKPFTVDELIGTVQEALGLPVPS